MLERTLIFLLLVLFYHGASFAAATKPDWRVEWEKTVAAAEKEGVVSIYIFDAGPLTEETVHAFERAYPKIKVSQLRGRGNALGPRLVAERRAGNQTLISLMRERAAAAAAARSASQANSEAHSIGSALATILDNPDQQAVDRESMRNEMRANLGLFFKLVKLSPEKINQYIDLQIEKESRKANRMSALFRGKVPLADALLEALRSHPEVIRCSSAGSSSGSTLVS